MPLDPAIAARIQSRLAAAGYYHGTIDGDFGPVSLAAVDAFTSHVLGDIAPVPQTAPIVPQNGLIVPQAAIDLILDAEGIDQPGQWPGGSSGITLGRGYDIGAGETAAELARDWTPHLGADAIARLTRAVGKTGSCAEQLAHNFTDIRITLEMADAVFLSATLPKYTAQTLAAFPGLELLAPIVLGAFVSLVFNRGTAFADSPDSPEHDRRREMRSMRDSIAHYRTLDTADRTASLPSLLRLLASQFRAMKRLWIGKGLDGLLTRREAEAKLVESAIPA